MTEIFKWLGALSPDTAGSAIGAFFAAFLLAAVARVKAHAEKARQKGYARVEAEAKAERAAASSAPPKQLQQSLPPKPDPRVAELERRVAAMVEWGESDLRARIKQLEAAYAEVSQDAARKAISLAAARDENEHAAERLQRSTRETALARAEAARKTSEIEHRDRRLAQLQRALTDAEGRIRKLEAESPHSAVTVPTPTLSKPRGAR